MSVAATLAPPRSDLRREDRGDFDPLHGFRFPPGHVLGPEDEGKLISREEYSELDVRPGWKVERAGGKLVFVPRVSRPHRRCSYPFRFHLSGYWTSHPDLVEDFEPERWVYVEDDTDRLPDAAVLLRHSPLAGDHLDCGRVPDLLFEFVSSGSEAHDRDYVDKRADYHRIGVREYVIVDPIERRVTVLRWEVDGYAESAVLGPADAYTSPLLPGLEVPLAEALDGDG